MKSIIKKASTSTGLTNDEIRSVLEEALTPHLPIKKLLILPPDITRMNSYAGQITIMLYQMLNEHTEIHILPALGTHVPMTEEELDYMYAGIPKSLFINHNWRNDVEMVGEVPANFVREVSDGLLDRPIPVEFNKRLLDKSYDLILSVGQVVPHEVVGMANFNKNIFVGCGGSHMINLSHYLGALYGMERMMGRDETPVHKVFDYAEQHFAAQLPLMYLLTVTTLEDHEIRVQSLAAGRDRKIFSESIKCSQQHNLNFLDAPLKKVVVYMDPQEFHTTWIGNKSIYRTRMAMADDGELIVIAPGIKGFGEDLQNDALIRKYGYCGRNQVLQWVQENDDLANNLSVAAHLIHGSSNGRFRITYAPGHLNKNETEKAGFIYMPLKDALDKYDVKSLKDGLNIVDGEEIFFIRNPALGLWADKTRFFGSSF